MFDGNVGESDEGSNSGFRELGCDGIVGVKQDEALGVVVRAVEDAVSNGVDGVVAVSAVRGVVVVIVVEYIIEDGITNPQTVEGNDGVARNVRYGFVGRNARGDDGVRGCVVVVGSTFTVGPVIVDVAGSSFDEGVDGGEGF